MADNSEVLFSFKSKGLSGDPLNVVGFEGREAVSELYEFRVDMVSGDPDLDAGLIVNQPATLEMEFKGDISRFHGIVASFEQREAGPEFVTYHAVLVPRVYRLGLTRRNRVFQGKTVPKILEEVLADIGLGAGTDFSVKAPSVSTEHEYVVQYQETDLDFLHRMMEHHGIYYFFEHGDTVEKFVAIDDREKQTPIGGDPILKFRGSRAISPVGEAVSALTFRQQVLPKSVQLKDYNYRKPSVTPEGKADAVPKGTGKVEEYGNHFKTPDEGSALATIRAQEITCRERIWRGISACRHLRSGLRFTLEEHFREANNIEYQLLEVIHRGRQLGVAGTAYGGRPDEPAYLNDFVAIPADVQFRPDRRTPRPRITGLMHATVDAANDGHYADIDDDGRYKVKLPFDLSDLKDGKASRHVRMAQPYAGHGDAPREYGMHFPLHKGTEVLLAHLDGDPDRPVIAGAVPNPATKSPVTAANATQSMMRTAGDNEQIFEDKDDAQYIFLKTPRYTSYLSMGEAHDPHAIPHGFAVGTEKGVSIHAGEGMIIAAGSKIHAEGKDKTKEGYESIAQTAGLVTALAALAGGGAADYATGWNIGSVVGAIGDIAGAAAGMTLPGIYQYAPGKVAICAGGEVVLGAIGSADVIAAGPANILSASEAMVAAIIGVAIVGGGSVEVISVRGDIRLHAKKKNIIGHAHEGIELKAEEADFDVEAKKHIVMNALEESFTLNAKKHITLMAEEEDFSLTAKKNVKIVAETEELTAQAKKKVEITSEEEDVMVGAKAKKVVIEGADSIELKSGQSSITLKNDGTITIKGMTVDISGTTELKGKGGTFTLEGTTSGTVKGGTLEVSATTMNTVKGNPVMIN